MNVTYRLTAVSTAVIYNAEALFKVFLLCYLGDRLEDLCDKAAVLGRYLCCRSDMLLRDHKDVNRRLGIDIPEGEDEFIFEDL